MNEVAMKLHAVLVATGMNTNDAWRLVFTLEDLIDVMIERRKDDR